MIANSSPLVDVGLKMGALSAGLDSASFGRRHFKNEHNNKIVPQYFRGVSVRGRECTPLAVCP